MLKALFTLSLTLALATPGRAQNSTSAQLQSIADNLLITTTHTARIQQVLPLVDDIQVVVLHPAYREFPTIMILKKDKNTNQWKRTFECLSPGIEPNPLDLLDWHALQPATGIDFVPNNIKVNSFTDNIIVKLIETSLTVKGGVLIPYQNFIHMHTADERNEKEFSPYTIDKTRYLDLANQLTNNQFKKFTTSDCMVFGTSPIKNCTFTKVSGLYQIQATTQNGQTWTYTFTGVDSSFRYLEKKQITVKKA